MAAALPKVAQDTSGLSAILQLFNTANAAMGTGKATSTTTKSPDPATMGQADELLKTILASASAPELDAMVANMFERGKQEFFPKALGASLGAGNRAYSDTTLKQLAAEAAARVTGEAAAARLSHINNTNQTAARLVGDKLQASSTIKQTSQTAASPLGKALQYGGMGLAGYSAYKKLKKPVKDLYDEIFAGGEGAAAGLFSDPGFTSSIGSSVDAALGGSFAAAPGAVDFNSFIPMFDPTLVEPAIGALGDVGSGFGDFATGASAVGDFAAGSFLEAGGGDFATSFVDSIYGTGADLALDAGVDAAAGLAGDALGGISFPYFTAAKVIGDAFEINEVQSLTGGIGEIISDVTGSVICTACYAKGDMPRKFYVANRRYGQDIPRHVLRGYQAWGKWFVKGMKKSALLYKLGKAMATAHARYVLGERTLFGKLLNRIGYPICSFIGKRLEHGRN